MERPTIGVVMIVKNEEALLARALESVRDADAIYITDTGSTDRTMEIARQYTPHVYDDFKWCDDFAAARNHAKKRATTDWILSLDADEFVHDFSHVRKAVEQGFLAIDCVLYAADNQQRHLFPRLFRNTPQVFWVGAIHNHLSAPADTLGNTIDVASGVAAAGPEVVEITYGYSPAHYNDPDRAMRICESEVRKRPMEAQRERFYLGREYFYRQRYEDTVVVLGQYVQTSRHMAEKAEAFLIMARSYWAMGMGDDARDACVQALIINSDFREALLFMAELSGEGRGVSRWDRNASRWRLLAQHATNADVLFVRDTA